MRVGLGLVWLAAAWLSGASGDRLARSHSSAARSTVCFAAFNDPRARFLRRGEPAAGTARRSRRGRGRSRRCRRRVPSTVGVSVLAAIAIVPQPVLAAFLGGISAGLGVAGVLGCGATTDPSLLPRRAPGSRLPQVTRTLRRVQNWVLTELDSGERVDLGAARPRALGRGRLLDRRRLARRGRRRGRRLALHRAPALQGHRAATARSRSPRSSTGSAAS